MVWKTYHRREGKEAFLEGPFLGEGKEAHLGVPSSLTEEVRPGA